MWRRILGVANFAVELDADHAVAPFVRDDPRAVDPWRIVPHVLRMAAFELGDPVFELVLMKIDDAALHARLWHEPRGDGQTGRQCFFSILIRPRTTP